jgi:hypothetical protein
LYHFISFLIIFSLFFSFFQFIGTPLDVISQALIWPNGPSKTVHLLIQQLDRKPPNLQSGSLNVWMIPASIAKYHLSANIDISLEA